jgi:hypothetical protein
VIDRVVELIRNIPRVQVLLLSLAERHHCSTWPWPLDAQRTSPASNVWHATWADGAKSGMSFSSFDCHCDPVAHQPNFLNPWPGEAKYRIKVLFEFALSGGQARINMELETVRFRPLTGCVAH